MIKEELKMTFTQKITRDEMKNRISMALKDPILQQGFEIICKELEQEKKLNAEIKARFVKCNTCTQEMKDKCLMFTENLCEGERCEELVDIMSLVEKRESNDKLKLAKDIIKKLISNAPNTYSGTDIELQQSKMFAFHNAINEAEEFIKE